MCVREKFHYDIMKLKGKLKREDKKYSNMIQKNITERDFENKKKELSVKRKRREKEK